MKKYSRYSLFSRTFAALIISALFIGLILIQPASAAGTVRYAIPTGGLGTGPCNTWAAACTLAHARSTAAIGDEIWFKAGTYYPTATADRTATISLKADVAFYGGFAGTETSRTQRNWVTNVTIFSGDIGTGGVNTDNSYHVVTGVGTSTAVLDGFTVTAGNANGTSPNNTGAGMYNLAVSPHVENVTFTNNSASSYGGGMFNNNSSPTLASVTFLSNSAALGGGMYNTTNSNPTLTTVSFTSNTASNGGGLYNTASNPILTGVTFTTNTATVDGGGMQNFANSNSTLTNVTFEGNSSGGLGGGLYNQGSPLTLTTVTFHLNTAVTSGGGFYSTTSNPALAGVTFSNNSATNGGGMYDVTGDVNMNTASFTGNTATNKGGGLYISSSPGSVLTNVTFTSNSATVVGGGMYAYNSTPSLTSTTFTNNNANEGGGLFNDGSNTILSIATFTDNTATAGAAIFDSASSASITDVAVNSNTATDSGGGIYNFNSSPSLVRVVFNENSAVNGGGMFNSAGLPTLNTVTFEKNTASKGGAMYNSATNVVVIQTEFLNNKATTSGGGIYNSNSSTPIFTELTFTGNTAVSLGGGIYNFLSSPSIEQSDFTNNTAGEGGGIYNNGSSPDLGAVTFTGNTANNGGGMYDYSNSNASLTNVVFSGNTATNNGGGLFNQGSAPAIDSVLFVLNSASFGGGMYNTTGVPNLTNVTFDHNNATRGGGLYNDNSAMTLADSTFLGNAATLNGGGLYNNNSTNPTLINTNFDANSATGLGGAVYNSYSTPLIANATFSTNDAEIGGGMYNYYSNAKLVNATMYGNTSVASGAGIYNSWSNMVMHNSILWENLPGELVNDGHSTPTITYSDLQDGCPLSSSCTVVIDVNPQFVNPPVDLRLTLYSPAIDAGDNSQVPPDSLDLNANGNTTEPLPVDIVNHPRFFDFPSTPDSGAGTPPIVDMGAYERQADVAPAALGDSYTTPLNTPLSVLAPGVLGNDTDVDGDPITAVQVTAPTNGTLTLNADGSFLYTPNAAFAGDDTFTYKASDSVLDSNVATVNIAVSTTDHAPVAVNDSYSTAEDTALVVSAAEGVLANDTDVDGDTLTAVLNVGPTHGTLTLNANGSFTYEPALNYHGPDSFTYHANDGTLNSNIATVSLTVTPVNDTPIALNDSYSTPEDTALIVAAPGVLANDTDVDGDTLTAVLDVGPTHGTLTLNPNGSFTYTPASNYHGPDSFTYHASDGSLSSNIATVNLTVTPVNDAPVAVNDSYTTPEDTALVVTAAEGVLANDTDVDGDTLTAVLDVGPTHGILTLNANGSFTYTPALNYHGPDSFTYHAYDGSLSSNIATVSLTVTPANDAPVAMNDNYSTPEDTALVVAAPGVLSNDTDVDGDPLTAVLNVSPTHGTLTLNSDGSFTYTPAANYHGPDSFTYHAYDGSLSSNIATVSLTVTSVNDAPVAVDDSYTIAEGTALVVLAPGVLTNDTDVDGDTLTAVLDVGPTHGTLTLNPDGSFTYTPDLNFHSVDTFTYHAYDGSLSSNIATVTITVTEMSRKYYLPVVLR